LWRGSKTIARGGEVEGNDRLKKGEKNQSAECETGDKCHEGSGKRDKKKRLRHQRVSDLSEEDGKISGTGREMGAGKGQKRDDLEKRAQAP